MQSPKCGNGNRPLDKAGALLALRCLLGEETVESAEPWALRLEEGHRGIRVMNVFPGTTRSNFGRNRLGARGPLAHQRVPPVSAEKVARRIAAAAERNRGSVYVSWIPDRMGVAANHLAGWAVTGVLRRWARSPHAGVDNPPRPSPARGEGDSDPN